VGKKKKSLERVVAGQIMNPILLTADYQSAGDAGIL